MVTARKREESLQNVGLAVSALSQTEIARTFARDISDLASVSPNLIIDVTAQGPGGVAAIFIRGIGAADVEKNFDRAVGDVVNGIFQDANAGSLLAVLTWPVSRYCVARRVRCSVAIRLAGL